MISNRVCNTCLARRVPRVGRTGVVHVWPAPSDRSRDTLESNSSSTCARFYPRSIVYLARSASRLATLLELRCNSRP
jgi:hypothetical protein